MRVCYVCCIKASRVILALDPQTTFVVNAVIIAAIMGPYGLILNQFINPTAGNIWTVVCGLLGLLFLAIGSIGFVVAAGVLIASHSPSTNCAATFLLSILFDQSTFFLFGIWNWVLYSWEGFLFCPSIPLGKNGFPSKNYPWLGKGPLNTLLRMYHMGDSTYFEDKKKFEELYPGIIAIDQVPINRLSLVIPH